MELCLGRGRRRGGEVDDNQVRGVVFLTLLFLILLAGRVSWR